MPAVSRKRAAERVLPASPSGVDEADRLRLAIERLTQLELMRACDPASGMSYVAFCERVFDLKLTAMQAEIARVLFDGEQPAPTTSTAIFGGMLDLPPEEARRTVLIAAGRGSGKSLTFVAARAIHMALTADCTPMMKGEPGLIPIVAPDQRQSRHTLEFVKGLLRNRPVVAKLLRYRETLDVVELTRLDGRVFTIEARPATGGGLAVRGSSLGGVLLEEAAFFDDEGAAVSDVEIYRAARPRLLPGAQIVLATTPWAQAGLVWELYKDSYGHPRRAVVARAPTLLMRPSRETEAMVRQEREDDPDNAAREFDAEFLSLDAERFFPEALIERCLDKSLVPDDDGMICEVATGERVRFGGDFAFDADSSALMGFVERSRPDVGNVRQPSVFWPCEVGEWRPTAERSLVPGQVVGEVALQIQRAGGKLVVADAHYRRSIEEHLSAAHLALVNLDGAVPDNFLVARTLMAQDRVRLPNMPRFLAQLRQIRSTHKPGGQVTIHLPRKKGGGHCDIVSAFVAALAGVSLTSTRAVAGPANYVEAEAREDARRRDERWKEREQKDRKEDRKLGRMMRRLVPGQLMRHLRGQGT